MSAALERQAVLGAVQSVRTHYLDIVTATGMERWQVSERLKELLASGEIVSDPEREEGCSFPAFRRVDLFDLVNA